GTEPPRQVARQQQIPAVAKNVADLNEVGPAHVLGGERGITPEELEVDAVPVEVVREADRGLVRRLVVQLGGGGGEAVTPSERRPERGGELQGRHRERQGGAPPV